jgi:lysophospholipase L1-like esterase
MFTSTLLKSRHLDSLILAVCMLMSTWNLFGQPDDSSKIWVGSWGTAPQLVEPGNIPPSPGLSNNSMRQIVRVSIGGDTLRVKFSNKFSTTPVTMNSVKIAVSAGGNAIFDSTNKKLTFGGNYEVTMDSEGEAISDPIAFDLQPRMTVALTIYFGTTSATITGHPGSRTTSYLVAGNDTSRTDFTGATPTDHWYVIQGIDVLVPPTYSCISVIGNSITDGRGTTTNMQNRWTDILSERLIANPGTEQVGVLNQGIGGNCVLRFCLGPAAIDRFQRDVLNQSGIKAGIIFEGVNDIGGVTNLAGSNTITNELIKAYKNMIDSAHARNIIVYGATITPFRGNGYYNAYSEITRRKVNQWIRNSGRFDGVIDFDRYMRSPGDSLAMQTSYQNDGLHPDAAGYQKMGDSIDLALFAGLDSILPAIDTTGIEYLWIEPECASVGDNWKLYRNFETSNEGYISADRGLNSLTDAPADAESLVNISFTVKNDTTYRIYGRVNCAGADDDSYWLKLDNGEFAISEGLTTNGWQWKELINYSLTTGEHSLTIAYREDGAYLDKLCITNDTAAPSGIGRTADVMCLLDTNTVVIGIPEVNDLPDTNFLDQNYPNPFINKTTIGFEVRQKTNVSLKVFTMLGDEIVELAGKEFNSGFHAVEFDGTYLSEGVYLYTLKTDKSSESKQMIVQAR